MDCYTGILLSITAAPFVNNGPIQHRQANCEIVKHFKKLKSEIFGLLLVCLLNKLIWDKN